jgi:hypothetical protein
MWRNRFYFIAMAFTLKEVIMTLQGNVNEMPMYFDMPSSSIIDIIGARSVIKCQAMKIQVIVRFAELVGSMKLPPIVILK